MSQKIIDPTANLKALTDDEVSQLFHVCVTNVDLFLKIMPDHPWLGLLKKNPNQALQGLVFIRSQK